MASIFNFIVYPLLEMQVSGNSPPILQDSMRGYITLQMQSLHGSSAFAANSIPSLKVLPASCEPVDTLAGEAVPNYIRNDSMSWVQAISQVQKGWPASGGIPDFPI